MFPATTRTFTKDTALLEQGRGAAWRVWINARHGRGTAWARHGHAMGTACYVWIRLKPPKFWRRLSYAMPDREITQRGLWR